VSEPRRRVAENMFCWNRHTGATPITAVLSETSEDVGTTESMMIPSMCGSFGVAHAIHLGVVVALAGIARTSVAWVGIRHHCRGSGSKGEVANFVDSKQLDKIEERNAVSSFNMFRGSVSLDWWRPLRDIFWEYNNNLEDEEEAIAPRKHFAALTFHCGSVTVIDLVGKDEALLGCPTGHAVSASQLPHTYMSEGPRAIRSIQYDYKAESRSGNVAALTELLLGTRSEVQAQRQYVDVLNPSRILQPVRWQMDVFRVNCLEWLGRINLVQQAVARSPSALEEQLKSLARMSTLASLDKVHNRVWADHRRTGKRTFGVSSMTGPSRSPATTKESSHRDARKIAKSLDQCFLHHPPHQYFLHHPPHLGTFPRSSNAMLA